MTTNVVINFIIRGRRRRRRRRLDWTGLTGASSTDRMQIGQGSRKSITAEAGHRPR